VKVGGRQCGVAVLSVNFLFLGVAPRGTMHAALRDHHRQGRTRARKGRRVKFEVIVNLYSKKQEQEARSKRTEAPVFLLIFLSQTHQIFKNKKTPKNPFI
jgi:hypothetical protein